jgi:hypothetical protein
MFWTNAVSIPAEHIFFPGLLARKPNRIFFVMKRVREHILYVPHSSTGCSENSSEKHYMWINNSIVNGLNRPITKICFCSRICSFKVSINDVLHGRRSNNFAALRPDDYETPISWDVKFYTTYSSRIIFEIQLQQQTVFQHCTCVEASFYITEGLTYTFALHKLHNSKINSDIANNHSYTRLWKYFRGAYVAS